MTPQFVIQPTPKRRTAFESPPASEEATPTTPDQGWIAPLPSMDARGEEEDLDHPPDVLEPQGDGLEALASTSHGVEDAREDVVALQWLGQDASVQGLVESGNEESSADDSSQEVQGGPDALPGLVGEPIVAIAAPNALQAMPLAFAAPVEPIGFASGGESVPSSPVPRPSVDDAETPLLQRHDAFYSSVHLPSRSLASEKPVIAPAQIEDSQEPLVEEVKQSMPFSRTAPADASSHKQHGQVASSPFRISQSQFGQIGKGLPTRLFSQAVDRKIKPEPCATSVARAHATRVQSRTLSIAGGKRPSLSVPKSKNTRPMAQPVTPEAARVPVEQQPCAAKVKPISLQLRDGNGDIVLLRVKPTALLSRVFEEFSKMKKVPSDHYRFYVDGKRLPGDATIAAVELEHDDIIDCLEPQVGGRLV
ncbi:hypothetical protein SPRG_10885 [Saprolegnia parasitica CBS 223.65]|uniref:Ubiquitin-like domain-containing protein n=1 Tax=Saprolegnia parasitica (strain CBS 223.65) TaxID=695850 RepID=A0A067C0P5_SAPPC|nr:hypothetical protein SPRG_10885 [Saprolegnia parasitica CBS 223.65]KDO24098.1 hypothetical protein SPRG_10885 [Saprolegnia parasitica CBS 223.65]|eukprot:XP_012205234.1 hypothetical protein SPRG_10885 [Saprolegnia parasitica CBS 223.65]